MNIRFVEAIKWLLVLSAFALLTVVLGKIASNLGDYVWDQFRQRVLGLPAEEEGDKVK